MTSVRVDAQTLWLPKAGATAAQYEDAFATSEEGALPFRAAVADGATESVFAKPWAQQLADGYVHEAATTPDAFRAAWPTWCRAWERRVRTTDLPWYVADKAEQGAFAAFVGLTLTADETWTALACGDCCLFQLREEDVITTWPMTAPDDFHHRPSLVGSQVTTPLPELRTREGRWQPGDRFLLATDALAAWLLSDHVHAIREVEASGFPTLIDVERDAGRLRNDDVTLVLLRTET